MLRGLLKAKAGFGPTMTYLFSSPLLNPIIIGLFFATFEWKVTLAYAVITLVISVAAGIILEGMHFEKYAIPEKILLALTEQWKLGLGAVMALIIGGGGASITEVILLKSMFRMPMIIVFLAVILGMAILVGYFFQFVL